MLQGLPLKSNRIDAFENACRIQNASHGKSGVLGKFIPEALGTVLLENDTLGFCCFVYQPLLCSSHKYFPPQISFLRFSFLACACADGSFLHRTCLLALRLVGLGVRTSAPSFWIIHQECFESRKEQQVPGYIFLLLSFTASLMFRMGSFPVAGLAARTFIWMFFQLMRK